MIEVKDLGKRYGDRVAIQNVSFTIGRGEILAFLGPNGAGKTTTMRILTGFMPATTGTATLAGFDIFENPMEVKRRIGYLPEHPPLYLDLTVTEYLKFVGKIKGLSGEKLTAGLNTAIEKCHLADVAKRLIANLSRGYRQRVGLAQALIHNPDVLILDEPTVGLDPKQIIEIRELIKTLQGEHTIILSTHILPEATAVCQKVVIINKGQVVAVDSPEKLSAQLHQSEKVSFTVREIDRFDPKKILALPAVQQLIPQPHHNGTFVIETALGSDIREDLARIIVENGWGLLELTSLRVSLEEVFLQLTTEEKPQEEVAPTEVAA